MGDVVGRAAFSDCKRYRYWLTRWWDERRDPLAWIMLNPSTADHRQDDPTIRRCMGFARDWGYGGIVVVNLFALRATNPTELVGHYSPVEAMSDHGENDATIHDAASRFDVVAAWGAHTEAKQRAAKVLEWFGTSGVGVSCLGVTKDGSPRHPLYVRKDANRVDLVEGARR